MSVAELAVRNPFLPYDYPGVTNPRMRETLVKSEEDLLIATRTHVDSGTIPALICDFLNNNGYRIRLDPVDRLIYQAGITKELSKPNTYHPDELRIGVALAIKLAELADETGSVYPKRRFNEISYLASVDLGEDPLKKQLQQPTKLDPPTLAHLRTIANEPTPSPASHPPFHLKFISGQLPEIPKLVLQPPTEIVENLQRRADIYQEAEANVDLGISPELQNFSPVFEEGLPVDVFPEPKVKVINTKPTRLKFNEYTPVNEINLSRGRTRTPEPRPIAKPTKDVVGPDPNPAFEASIQRNTSVYQLSADFRYQDTTPLGKPDPLQDPIPASDEIYQALQDKIAQIHGKRDQARPTININPEHIKRWPREFVITLKLPKDQIPVNYESLGISQEYAEKLVKEHLGGRYLFRGGVRKIITNQDLWVATRRIINQFQATLTSEYPDPVVLDRLKDPQKNRPHATAS